MKSTKVYVSRVLVRVSGIASVIDMMRYDNCVPDSERDSAKLEALAHNGGHGIEVSFRRFAYVPGGPSKERWHSYNCEIVRWEPV